MKLNIFRFSIIFLAILFSSSVSGVEVRSGEIINQERALERELKNYLSQILPIDSFAVSVAMAGGKRKVKVIDQEIAEVLANRQREKQLRQALQTDVEEESETGEGEFLPGLEPAIDTPSEETNADDFGLSARNELLASRFEEQLRVDRVDVQITVDNDVPTETQNAINNAISRKLETLYQGNALLTIIPVNIQSSVDEQGSAIAEVPPFNPDTAQEGLPEDGFLGAYTPLFYIALFLVAMILFTLLVFSFLLLLFRFLSNRDQNRQDPLVKKKDSESKLGPDGADPKPKKPLGEGMGTFPGFQYPSSPNVPPPRTEERSALSRSTAVGGVSQAVAERPIKIPNNGFEQETLTTEKTGQSPQNLLEMETNFVVAFLKEPLSAREYLSKLDQNSKNALFMSFSNQSIKSQFGKLDSSLRDDPTIFEEKTPQEISGIKKNAFSSAIEGLEQYRRLMEFQIKDPIARLSFLNEDEIAIIFSSLPTNTLVDLSRYVDSDLMLSYIKRLSESRKREVLKEMGEQQREISQEDFSDLKFKLDKQIDILAENLFLKRLGEEKLLETLFAASRDSKGLLKEIEEQNKEVYDRFKQYGVTFEDMLENFQSQDFIRLVDGAENEELATIGLGLSQEMRERLFSPLSENRREIVETLLFTKQGTVPRDVVMSARQSLLDQYRQTLG